MALLHLPLAWFHRIEIVRVLCRSPHSYVHLETMLLKTAPFEHYFEDEVDLLDDTAAVLFHELLED